MDCQKILDKIKELNPAIEFQSDKNEIIHKILVRCLLEISFEVATLDFIREKKFLTEKQMRQVNLNRDKITNSRDGKIEKMLESFSYYF